MNRGGQGTLHDFDTGALITGALLRQATEAISKLEQGAAATSHDSFFDGCAGGVEGVLDPQLAVIQLGFRRCTDLDHGHTTGELGDAFVQFLPVVIGFRGVQFPFDRGNPVSDGSAVVVGGDDGGGFLADRHASGLAEVSEADGIQGHRLVFADQRAAGEDGDVGKRRLAAFAEGWGPDGGHLKHATALVHHQRGEGFTLDFLGQDQQWRTTALHRLQHRDQVGHGADLAIGEQDQRVVEFADLTVGIGDEIRRAVTAVEGHAFGDLQFRRQRLGFLHGDDAIDADAIHRFGDHPTDFLITTGTHRGDLTNSVTGHGLAALAQAANDLSSGLFHATPQFHRARPRGSVAQTFLNHGLGQNRGGGRAVACLVLGLGGHLLNQLGSEIFEGIFQFDIPGDGVAVIDDVRGSELLLEHHVAAAGADGDLHRIG